MERDLNTARLAAEIRRQQHEGSKTEEEILTSRIGAMTAHQVFRNMSASEGEWGKTGSGFEADVRRRKAEARLMELDIPRAEGQAKFEEKLGSTHQFVRFLLEAMRGMNFPGRR